MTGSTQSSGSAPYPEWAASQWLGRRITVTLHRSPERVSGRLCHVSTRSAFLMQPDRSAPDVLLVPLAAIALIEGDDREATT